ncbi:type II toxin-antitoxin system RelE/ParE family toxin [Candidatus Peregrinibacteria bacterium]|jgi:mRNA interferase RelE/StbE|nr:type II toxin-antitoxin system RelE/ParE family toxin [Candidatus Peregrinibacteria bacterium]MBT7484032.1 type II toxin-antitoxin system RelE/ParE family toxin [Candidatus Peregrinibacteria bacterium]MBT7703135.1 type II toxin-antitoxin system RelE/ParE family toxin [Candidatus Peregrinibacteria bacterium]
MFKVIISKRVYRQLKKFPQKTKSRASLVINKLAENPFQGKKLGGQRKESYSVRMWPYRIIYRIHKKEVLVYIIDIGHRRDVYS